MPPQFHPAHLALSFVLATLPVGHARAQDTGLESACPEMAGVKTEIVQLAPRIEDREYTCQILTTSDITEELASSTDDLIFFCPILEDGGPGQALIRIDSYGGDIKQAKAFIDAMEYRGDSLHTITVALSNASSAAAYMFIAGDERYALPRTTFKLHGTSWSGSDLSAEDVARFAERAETDRKQNIGFLMRHTGVSKGCATYLVGRDGQDTELTARQALGLGLVDGILGANGNVEVRVGEYEAVVPNP